MNLFRFLLLAFLVYLYLIFTFKLSRKNLKFPANLINSIFQSNLFLIIIIFMTQKTNKNIKFERLGLFANIVVEYYNMFVNILYFSSILLLSIYHTEIGITKISKVIKLIWNYFYVILVLIGLSLYFFSNFPFTAGVKSAKAIALSLFRYSF